MTTEPSTSKTDWVIACHLDYGDASALAIVREHDGGIVAESLPVTTAAGGDINHRVAFIGIDDRNRPVIHNPQTKETAAVPAMPADARFAYAYRDPGSARVWFMNDGDRDGNDTLCCGQNGSSVAIVSKDNGGADFVDTLCVGRGHHVTAFSQPTDAFPGMPHRAFVSNLKDGTISVLGNDPSDAVSFLKVIATVNLCDTRFEKESDVSIPNSAFPHGMEFSPLTGKLYCLSNGYHSVAVVDPFNQEVEKTVQMEVSSNLLLSPCGGFLIGKGADRKSDPDHVMGRLSVMDVVKGEMVFSLDLPDIYPSVYRFGPGGDKLYVTTAATGKDVQRQNLKTGVLQIYDATALPELTLLKEIELAPTDSGRRPIAFFERGDGSLAFVPNPTQGTLTVLDAGSDEVLATVNLGAGDIQEFSFSFWNDRRVYGA